MRRDGEFFFTFSGVQFWPLDPHADDINIEDIAHGLAHTCRWGGHSREFYSVAQHSVLCSRYVAPQHRFVALMHDAAEAYIGDVKRPLKYAMPNLLDIEHAIWQLIADKYGLPSIIPLNVKTVDDQLLIAERDAFIHPSCKRVQWPIDRNGYGNLAITPGELHALSPAASKDLFLKTFFNIGR